MTFNNILEKYRKFSFSKEDLGSRFERLMQAYLLTDPKYAARFKKVWLWSDFFAKDDLGGHDTGIDLVCLTNEGDFWAVQCKCFQEDSYIDKPAVDTFLSTSSRKFTDENLQTTQFAHRLWISTTNKWTTNAEDAIKNQNPPVSRINLYDLQNAPVDWEKLEEGVHGEKAQAAKKELRPHQKKAVNDALEYFRENDRGKLIMACGTGKTFTSLRIAEKQTDGKGLVLFLVPSIALLGQILNDWYADAKERINAICICSDPDVSKKRGKNEDIDVTSVVDLALPASTNVENIVRQFKIFSKRENAGMTVVFSTYQSIEVIAKAQKALAKELPQYAAFDLIVCDEAHRTTGVTLSGEDESAFVKVHDSDFITAKKRLYMTATPRLYSDDSKSKAAEADAVLCSMDDEKMYGGEIYRIGFGQAVEAELLTDYKVLILTLNQGDISAAVQKMIADDENEINTDDVSKLIGCINAVSKQVLGDGGSIKETDPEPMRRAVAFCQSIKISKNITTTFNTAAEAYINDLPQEKREKTQAIAAKHIDGTMNATQRNDLLAWLKDEPQEGECRVLTNVRCLSEGIDVPSLDAVMFLSARNSQVDVVQSVGRVMRKSEGKKYGYIIIPVVVPFTVEAEKALDDNERYRVVWTVLNALRAHDDRFNAIINKIDFNKSKPLNILVATPDVSFDDDGCPFWKSDNDGNSSQTAKDIAEQLTIQFEQLQNVVFARMVQKVGDKHYWEQWAKTVAEIAERQIERITFLVGQREKNIREQTKQDNGQGNFQSMFSMSQSLFPHIEIKNTFDDFLSGLQKNINTSITAVDAIEMLSQHIITKPVFEALFENYSFVKNNPISVSMQRMLDLLEAQAIEKDTEVLQKFYDSVKLKVSSIDNAEGKQRIINKLYDNFFKIAFPKMVARLGIVYTPVEVVDFIIHSVNDILKQEFGKTVSDEGINILDPFTGTGTFITRLIQSGLIDRKDLERKYRRELFANEIVLLAYYIAAVNIENAYHDVISSNKYFPFDGICLTDTFQLYEELEREKTIEEANRKWRRFQFQDKIHSDENTERIQRQQTSPLTVIMGNPPYSVGQRSANDNEQNQSYPKLDARIEKTYAAGSMASSVKALYDAYIKAFRWSSDRLGNNDGIIAFVSNGAWLDGNGMDAFRKCLEKEFAAIYVFNLRGNQRTSGELSRREGGKIFGSGSRTPIAITVLVQKQVYKPNKAKIYYFDIGDYLSREEKLSIVKKFRTISNMELTELTPNEHGDWINMRKGMPGIAIEPEKKFDLSCKSFFITHSLGTATGRDTWAYNFSKDRLVNNMKFTIDFYNQQSEKYTIAKKENPKLNVTDFIDTDTKKISWNANLIEDLEKFKIHSFASENVIIGHYRPFCKQIMYFDKDFNARTYQNKRLYPNKNAKNIVISVSGLGATVPFSTLIINNVSDLGLISAGQCFPLYYYEENKIKQGNLFDEANKTQYIRRDAVSDFILERAKKQYGKNVTKEDIFYYVYGFLHSPKYRETFASDLKKMLPRLPLVDDVRDFWAFSKAGRKLAELHLNYENAGKYPGVIEMYNPLNIANTLKQANAEEMEYLNYRVEKMRFPKKDQKDTIIYNSQITIENIPAEACEYVVNGKSAIEWIMERYQISTHKESGITNNPNDWARETGNPRYILDLLLSVINVSMQTVGIVKELPKVRFDE